MKFSQMPYKRVDIGGMEAIFADITARFNESGSAREQYALYLEVAKYTSTVYTMHALCYVRHTIDTRDEFYDKENDFYDENSPKIQMLVLGFYKTMLNSKFRPELEEIMGKLWFDNAELALKGYDERIIPLMQQDNALCSEYKKLLASAKLEFDGQTVNLSQLRAYQLSKDRETRKSAFAKRTEFFMANAEKLDEIFDKLVALRDQMAKELGYQSFTELGYIRMNRNSYDEGQVARFREQVKKELVPLTLKLHEARRKNLGLSGLKFYDEDIFFPDGNPAPKGTPEEIFENGRKMYAELSPETGEFINFMLENELFDALAKEGKSGGGYCITLPDFKAPFVFANFNGTSEDVDVLTHECGHALNAYLAADMEIMEYQDSTYDVAEIHSMSMEFFTADWMKLFFGDETKKYLFLHLASALIFIPYGCMVDEFQHEVYNNPAMTPAERKSLWKRLEGEYKPYLDYDGDPFMGNGGRWQAQSHIYERPFYYIDYCLAQTCALQYRVWMEKDRRAAWQSYIELSRKAGSDTFSGLLRDAGLDSPFEPGCIANIIEGCEKILKELE